MRFCLFSLFALLLACGSPDQSGSSMMDDQIPAAGPPRSPGSADQGAAQVCTGMAMAGLGVSIYYDLGAERGASVTMISESGETELLVSFTPELEGWRIEEGGAVRLAHRQALSGAWEKSGNFRVLLQQNGKILEEKQVTIPQGDCHVEGQSLSFTIAAREPYVLDPSKEYYPLDGGSLLILDPSTARASIEGTDQTWQDVEIVRQLDEHRTEGQAASMSKVLESEPAGKNIFASFHERGIDRGPLPSGQFRDLGERKLFGRMQ